MRVVCVCIDAAAADVAALFPFIAEEMPWKCGTPGAAAWGGIASRGARGRSDYKYKYTLQLRKTVLIAFIVWPRVAGSRALDLCTRLAYAHASVCFVYAS